MKKIIHSKYFVHFIIIAVMVVVITLYILKSKKEEQFNLTIKAIQDPSTIQGRNNSSTLSAPFDPRYWKTKSGATLITSINVESFIKTIYDADRVGPFNDDDGVVGVFKKLGFVTQISYLSDKFQTKYRTDLYQYIKGFMKPENLATLEALVSRMK